VKPDIARNLFDKTICLPSRNGWTGRLEHAIKGRRAQQRE
jgi:hypothetical protein